jgi:DNA-binding ferritin-like protein
MKITHSRLRKLIAEELAIVAVDPGALSDALNHAPGDDLLHEKMTCLLGCLRAANLWFHAAHNLAKGPGFLGDHIDLYGEIYEQLNGDYDVAAEKAIALTGDEGVACPQRVVAHAAEKLQDYPSPSGMASSGIAHSGLEMMMGLNEKVSEMFDLLEEAGSLSLGLNDFLAGAANQYETYIYLLQQRVKG